MGRTNYRNSSSRSSSFINSKRNKVNSSRNNLNNQRNSWKTRSRVVKIIRQYLVNSNLVQFSSQVRKAYLYPRPRNTKKNSISLSLPIFTTLPNALEKIQKINLLWKKMEMRLQQIIKSGLVITKSKISLKD